MNFTSVQSFLSIVLIHLALNYSIAQTPVFNSGLIAGLNFSELEGKGVTDYFGLNTGIIGTARLTKHSQLGMEILFSQNGEYVLPEYYPPLQYGKVRLNHVEVPLHIDWLFGVLEKENYYDVNMSLGLAYTRLLSYNVESIEKENVNDEIVYGRKDAMLLQMGTTYFFTKNVGLNFRASLPIRIEGLSWTLAARLIYMIR